MNMNITAASVLNRTFLRLFSFFIVSSLIITSCQKKAGDDPSPDDPTSNVDLTGTYTGLLTSSTSIDSTTIVIRNKSNNVYIASSDGIDVAELTVTGKNFTGIDLGPGEFKSLSGSLNGDVLKFNGVDIDNEPFSFTGTRTSSPPSNDVDLTGSYEGEFIDQFSAYNVTFDIAKNANSTFTLSESGMEIAILTVTGNSFTGSPTNGADFKSLSGALNGDNLTFSGIDSENQSFSFSGTRVTGGGGNPGDITIDGVTYTFDFSDCGADYMAAHYYEEGNQSNTASLAIAFDAAYGVGTYTVVSIFNSGPSVYDVNAFLTIGGSSIYGSAGTIIVSQSGSLSATLDGIVFNIDSGNNIISQVNVKGNLICQ